MQPLRPCSDTGRCYAFGRGDNGQLGLGNTQDTALPKPLRAISTRISNIAAGLAHSAVVTDGRCYTFGRGAHGRLGHKVVGNQLQPKLVEAFIQKSIVQAACGRKHTVVLDCEGRIYTFGEGQHGQLGHGDRVDRKLPQLVATEVAYKRIVCGDRNTAAIASNGECYVFGRGQGREGEDSLVPVMVAGLHSHNTCEIAVGGSHIVALVGHAPALSLDMRALLNSNDFSDITFIVEARPLYAHKVILACRSSTFHEQFCETQGTAQLVITDTKYSIFFGLLEFIYTDTTHLSTENAAEIKGQATKYGLSSLVALCDRILCPPSDPRKVPSNKEVPRSTLAVDLLSALKQCRRFADTAFAIRAASATECSAAPRETLIFAHKCILAARCAYFRAMFSSGMRESAGIVIDGTGEALGLENAITVENFNYSLFIQMVHWLYGGTPDLRPQSVVELLMCATQYHVHPLQQICQAYLESNIDKDNAVAILLMAHECGMDRLCVAATQWISKNLTLVKDNCDGARWEAIPASLQSKLAATQAKSVTHHPSRTTGPTVHVMEEDLYGTANIVMYSELKVTKEMQRAIVAARQARSWTRKQLANALQQKETLVADYETGRAIPQLALVKKMEKVLQTQLSHLMPRSAKQATKNLNKA